jgi:hypothetical protein
MWPISWLDHLRGSRRGRTGRPNRPAVRPRRSTSLPLLELLEDRTVPSFLPTVNYTVGQSPQAVVSADFNRDGKIDLATVNYQDNTVNELLGKGDGTFQAAKTFGTGQGPVSLAVGDFNKDGKLDLVTANSGGDVTVLFGNGDGTFGAAASFTLPTEFPPGYTGSDPLPQTPLSVAVGDFNHDGKLDLVVTGQTSFTWVYYGYSGNYNITSTNGYANVLLGDGSGGFSAGDAHALGSSAPASVQVGDFNGDGKLDIVTANRDRNDVSVLLGNGDGSLGIEANYYPDRASGSPTASVALGDVNGDGKLDLVTANPDGSVGVLLGNGDGTFQAGKTSPVGASAWSLALADLNNDGHLDVVTANYGSGNVSALLGKGDGAFSLPISTTADTEPFAVTAGDFNGDGRPDVAVANAGSANVSVLLNDGAWPAPNAPSLSINNVSVTEGNTGTTNAVFTVSLSAASAQTITVHYDTADGTATVADNDYVAKSGTLTFAPGQTSAIFSVPVVGDRIAEPNETFRVSLSQPTNAFLSLNDSTGVGTIIDDEPRISINNVTQNEPGHGSTSFVFTVSLSTAYDAPVTVHYYTSDGTATVADGDYRATSGTLTFAPGQTSATISVTVLKDVTTTSTEGFYVILSNPSADALITNAFGLGTIVSSTNGGGKHPTKASSDTLSADSSLVDVILSADSSNGHKHN